VNTETTDPLRSDSPLPEGGGPGRWVPARGMNTTVHARHASLPRPEGARTLPGAPRFASPWNLAPLASSARTGKRAPQTCTLQFPGSITANSSTLHQCARVRRTRTFAALIAFALAPTALAQHEWHQFSAGPFRSSTTALIAPNLTAPTWVRSTDAQGNAITFSAQSGPAVSLDLVLAQGSVTPPSQPKQHKLFAIDRRTGAIAWAAPVPAPAFDSRSTPAIDAIHQTVLVASGAFVTALNLDTGAQVWQAPLSHPVVDASPLVSSGWGHDGLGLANRCFITEYDGFGDDGRLTCINIDAFRADYNPFQPGDVVWSVVIGASSGNTPALWNGRVYVTTAGLYGSGPGEVLCFNARAASPPAPLWSVENPSGESCFGGVCIRPRTGGADVYAASYAFFGNTTSANLLKLDALTGGLAGYGTVPTLQVFRDDQTSATLLWESAAATWTDTNFNGIMNLGEFLVLGGWSHQPLVTSGGAPRLFIGALPTNGAGTGACTDLYAIDLSKLPTTPGPAQPGYLAQHFAGAGSTPAAADSNIYTLGASGLFAFGPPPFRYDIDGNGTLDIGDLYSWEQGMGSRDVNLDGPVTSADRDALIVELRRNELEDMRAGREP